MFCRPNIVLPSVYSKALSFYETVCMIAQRVEDIKQMVEQYEQSYKEYTDEQIALLREEVNATLTNTVNELNRQYKEFTSIVNSNIQLFQVQLDNLDKKIDDSIIGVDQRIDLAIEQNNEYLLDKISEGFIDLKVINFFTGENVSIQEMFDYLASFHATDAITYDELADRNKTYNQLIAYHIDYTRLVTQGGTIIV